MQDRRKLKIMLIEDDVAEVLISMLKAIGHQVVAVTNGQLGLEIFQKIFFDLLITDWLMPEMTGQQIIVEAKKINPSIPIMVLSGTAQLIHPGCGADLIVSKPLKINELETAINSVV